MADNVTLDPGTGGAVVATDDDGTAQHQYVKLEYGADGTQTKVAPGANALPVQGTLTANAGTNLNTSALATESGGNLALIQAATALEAASLGVIDDWDESDRAKVNPIAGQAGVQGGSGSVNALTQRVVLATDVALPTGANTIGRVTQTQTPSWTDGTTVLAIQALAKGAVARATFDLTGKPGARLGIFIGRTGATALDVGIAVRVRRIMVTPTPDIKWPGVSEFAATSDIAAAVSGVCEDSGNPNNAGVTSLTLDAAKTFVAGTNGEIILFICDNTTTPTTASEFVRQSVATSTTVKLLDAPTLSNHNNTAHTVSDKSNQWMPWLEGGSQYEIIVDYGAATTGDTAVIGAYLQTLDSLGSV